MTDKKVSVVINTKNRAKLLPRAIISILNQTYQNYELIIVDGGSSDNTRDVVQQFKDNRIQYFRVENEKNSASTLNYAFTLCKGEYIALQDDDDESLPLRIEKQLQLFEKSDTKLGIVYCWEEFWDDQYDKSIRISKPGLRGNIFWDLLKKAGGTGGGTQLMIKNEVIRNIGGLNENLMLSSDYLFYLRASQYYSFDFIPEVLVRTHVNHVYNRVSDNISNQKYWIDQAIELERYILTSFKQEFDMRPYLKLYHLSSILKAHAKLGKYKMIFPMIGEIINCNPFSYVTYFELAKVMKIIFMQAINSNSLDNNK